MVSKPVAFCRELVWVSCLGDGDGKEPQDIGLFA